MDVHMEQLCTFMSTCTYAYTYIASQLPLPLPHYLDNEGEGGVIVSHNLTHFRALDPMKLFQIQSENISVLVFFGH